MKKSRSLLLASALAVASLLPMAGPASAQVPSCVDTWLDDSGWTDYLNVYNGCDTAQRIKVVLANHTDEPCTTIYPGDSKDFEWGYPGRFDRLEYC